MVPRKPDGFRLKVFLWDESRFFVSKVIFIQSKGAHTMSDYRIETKCVQGGYTPGNGEPRQIPIVQSTTFKSVSYTHLTLPTT